MTYSSFLQWTSARDYRNRFPGINQVAEQLGVERTHLYRVLIGSRTSKRLLSQVRALGLPWKLNKK
jgi:DNA-binding phage protein